MLRALLEVGGRGGNEDCITMIMNQTSLSTLYMAVQTGHLEIVKMLLEVGRKNLVMICPFTDAKTALDEAMCISDVKIGTLLLHFGGSDLYNQSFFRVVNNVRKHRRLDKEDHRFLKCCWNLKEEAKKESDKKFLVTVENFFTRFMAGDTSLFEEIHQNAASNGPVQLLCREALKRKRVES